MDKPTQPKMTMIIINLNNRFIPRHPTCFTLSTRTTIEATVQRIASMVCAHGPEREMPTTEAIAQGIASMLCAHGPEVEWRICTVWEDA
ncbi:GIGANTEA-like protein [Tanacetum coccineum]